MNTMNRMNSSSFCTVLTAPCPSRWHHKTNYVYHPYVVWPPFPCAAHEPWKQKLWCSRSSTNRSVSLWVYTDSADYKRTKTIDPCPLASRDVPHFRQTKFKLNLILLYIYFGSQGTYLDNTLAIVNSYTLGPIQFCVIYAFIDSLS